MTIEEQAQILSEAVAETRAARHHYQGDIKEEERRIEAQLASLRPMLADAGLLTPDGDVKEDALRKVVMPSLKNAGGLEFSMLGKRFTVEQSDFESIIN